MSRLLKFKTLRNLDRWGAQYQMGGVFGKSKPKKRAVSAHDQAVLDLKVQRDKVKQYQKKVIPNKNLMLCSVASSMHLLIHPTETTLLRPIVTVVWRERESKFAFFVSLCRLFVRLQRLTPYYVLVSKKPLSPRSFLPCFLLLNGWLVPCVRVLVFLCI